MSARNLRVELSAKASRDARSIQLFTVKQWGSEQAALYDEAILQALEMLRSHPELGRHRKELGLDLRSYRVNSHTIFLPGHRGSIVCFPNSSPPDGSRSRTIDMIAIASACGRLSATYLAVIRAASVPSSSRVWRIDGHGNYPQARN